MLTTYRLDELKGGAGPGNRGADFAVFRAEAGPPLGAVALRGEFRMYTQDWIKRGRPVTLQIDLPITEEP